MVMQNVEYGKEINRRGMAAAWVDSSMNVGTLIKQGYIVQVVKLTQLGTQ